jgi:serine protease AprX
VKYGRNLDTYGSSASQIQMHQTDFLHRMGFMGESIRLAVIDAGFLRYDVLPTFDSIRNNGQIMDTWDFVDNENSVSEDHVHGMQCFSVIGANMPGTFVGSAPKADFYLYRTEDVATEYPIEEHNLACAAERADSAGVDICSISLGYTNFSNPSFNHTYDEMNGNKCLSSKAVQKGNEKGMLFVVAAGNEGNGSWRYISAPADADSIIAVGAVNGNREVAGFSSYGPSFDNRIKPDMASHGWGATVANSSTGEPTNGNGTSFACPNLAGVASCLWQGFKEKKQKDIIAALKESSDNFNTPDDRTGYGIPDAKAAFVRLQKTTFSHNETFFACKATLSLSIKCNSLMTLHIDRKFPGENDFMPITDLTATEPWGLHSFEWQDELGTYDFPEVHYRYRLSIGNDTSYALDSTTVAYSHPCAPAPMIINTDSVSVFPNPASHSAKLNFYSSAEGEANLDLWNANGKCIYRKKMQVIKGWHTETLDLRMYNQGLYILKIRRPDGSLVTEKIIVTG